jgi:anti-sigma-K factor RskA
MTREEVIELIPLYAVGALDADEARVMEDYLRDASSGDLQELADWREVVSILPLALPAATPSPLVKDRLMARIAEEAESQPLTTQAPAIEAPAKVLPFTPARKAASSPAQWMLLAASILLACTTVYFYLRDSQGEADRAQLTASLEQKDEENKRLNESLNAATRMLSMEGNGSAANAKVLWDTKEQVWTVVVYNLPTLPSSQDYQLWYVTSKNQPISAAVFSTKSNEPTVLKIKLPPEALKGLSATAITVEKKGGVEKPTTKPSLQAAI